MTLNVGLTPGLGAETEAYIHNKWDTLDEVEFTVALMGLPPMDKPNFSAPDINQALYTALSSGDGQTLTFEHTRFCAWYSYAQSRLSHFKGLQRQTENEMREIRNRIRKTIVDAATTKSDKKPAGDVIEQEAELDPRYQLLMLQLQKIEQTVDLLDGHAKKFASGKSLTSRSVEVRRQDMEGANGGRAYGNRGRSEGGM